MDPRSGVRRGAAGLVALGVLASVPLGGGGAAAGPGFVVSTLPNPVFNGADTEPSLRIAPDGTVYVGAIRGFPKGVDLWRVGASGGPAAYLGSPDTVVPTPCCTGLGGGDMDLAIAADGTVAYTSLWLGSLTVGRSGDGGRTFVSQPLGSPVVGDDRPWLATDGRAMYMTFHDLLTGNIDVERSEPGPEAGLVYAPQRPILPPADAAVGNNQIGPLLADRRHPGLLYQVYTTTSEPEISIGNGPGTGQNSVRMAVSTDGGATWTQHAVLTGPVAAGYASIFPAAALDRAGNVYVAVSDNSGILVLSSGDRGTTWRGPVRVDPPLGGATVFPWIAAGGDGGVVVGWLGSRVAGVDAPDASWQVFAAESLNGAAPTPSYRVFTVSDRIVHHKGICEQGIGCRSGRELGDFFSVAVGPDGVGNFAWADDGLGGPTVVRYARGGLVLGPPN
jgi:hypothetical protein